MNCELRILVKIFTDKICEKQLGTLERPATAHLNFRFSCTFLNFLQDPAFFSKIFTQELRHIGINSSSSVSTVLLAKTKAIPHLLTYATAFSGCHFLSRNAKAWKFKRNLLQKEEPRSS